MRASHDRAAVVKSVATILGRARGLALTPDLAGALGAALAARWPGAMTVEEGAHFFQGMHAGLVLDDAVIRERANNVAACVVAHAEVAA